MPNYFSPWPLGERREAVPPSARTQEEKTPPANSGPPADGEVAQPNGGDCAPEETWKAIGAVMLKLIGERARGPGKLVVL